MKKSEFYAAMCICIILCSMSTVFAVSYQPQIIQPTKPVHTDFYNATGTLNTYYTVVDYTGRGQLSRVSFSCNNANASNDLLYIKITVDGGTPVEMRGATRSDNITTGIANRTFDAAAGNSVNIFDYVCSLYFKTSLKIEIKQNTAIDRPLYATVDYATE